MRILAISSGYGLFRPMSGGRSRFYNIIRQLSNRNDLRIIQPVLYKSKNDSSIAHTTYFVNAFGGKTFALLADLNPSFLINVTKIILQFRPHIVQVSSPFGLTAVKIIIKLCRSKCFIVYDAHNVESDIYTIGAKTWIERLLVNFYITWLEKESVNRADKIITVSTVDRTRFMNKFSVSSEKFSVVPSGATLCQAKTQYECKDSEKCIIVFHGSYFHPPNKEAIDLIKGYIAPRLAEFFPGAYYILAGEGLPAFEMSTIKSMGYVPDIYNFLAMADIAIVPILNGGGTRLKILDYMSVGLPIVTTRKGIEGVEFGEVVPAKIVETVDETFVNAIMELLRSQEKRMDLGREARRLVEDSYDWTKIGANLNSLYNKMCKNLNRRLSGVI